MSEQQGENDTDDQGSGSDAEVDTGEQGEVTDDQLPADVQPTEDNPLARHPQQTGDHDDEIGADREGDPETAPMSEDDADFGGAGSGDSEDS